MLARWYLHRSLWSLYHIKWTVLFPEVSVTQVVSPLANRSLTKPSENSNSWNSASCDRMEVMRELRSSSMPVTAHCNPQIKIFNGRSGPWMTLPSLSLNGPGILKRFHKLDTNLGVTCSSLQIWTWNWSAFNLPTISNLIISYNHSCLLILTVWICIQPIAEKIYPEIGQVVRANRMLILLLALIKSLPLLSTATHTFTLT